MRWSRSTIGAALATSVALAGCFRPGGLDEATGTTTGGGTSSTTGMTTTTPLTDESGPVTAEVSTTGDASATGVTSTTGSTGSTSATSEGGTEPSSTGTTLPVLECGDGIVAPGEQCDDGDLAGGDGCSATCQRDALIVFLSSAMTSGAFGGSGMADVTCQTLATVAGLPGDYVAWISDGNSAPALARIGNSLELPYILPNGTVVATSTADLLDGTLGASINETEAGDLVVALGPCMGTNNVWTGTNASGALLDPTCNNWSSSSDQVSGSVGLFNADDAAWSDASCAQTCDKQLRFYCIGVPPP